MEDQHVLRSVFIGGCSRSGTTLLGAVLASHSACVAVPESHFKTEVLRELQDDPRGPVATAEALGRIQRHRRFKQWGLSMDDVTRMHGKIQRSYADLVRSLVKEYGKKNAPGKRPGVWVDHTPSNLKYAGLLSSLFPEARFIHIIRDGRAVAASILPLDWGPNTAPEAARFWLQSLAEGFGAEEFLGPHRIIRVRYEDLVNDPSTIVKGLCEFLDLDVEDQMEWAEGFRVPEYTRKQHALVGKRPDRARIGGWRQALSPRQIEMFEAECGDVLEFLGYKPVCGHMAKRPGFFFRMILEIYELGVRYGYNSIRHELRRKRAVRKTP